MKRGVIMDWEIMMGLSGIYMLLIMNMGMVYAVGKRLGKDEENRTTAIIKNLKGLKVR
jgi:uncharacterized protein YdaU (DUF1376 family)